MTITPTTQEEREIAIAMQGAAQLVAMLRQRFPALPLSAISVGLINHGVQVGVQDVGDAVTAIYLREVADKIMEAGE